MTKGETYLIPSDGNEFVISEIVFSQKQKTVPLFVHIKYTKTNTKTYLLCVGAADFEKAVHCGIFIKQ